MRRNSRFWVAIAGFAAAATLLVAGGLHGWRERFHGIVATGALPRLMAACGFRAAAARFGMAIIDEVEATARGVYSGALGWLGFDGRADLSVVIRTLVHRDGRYTFGTGGGVTVQSDVDSEYAETQWKAGRLIDAVRGTHTGDPDPSWLTERQP